jgi:hypothetical protein
MSGPDFEKDNAEMTEFEQALARAMQRVDVRAETTAKLLALADEADRKPVHAGGSFRLIKFSKGGRMFATPRPRAWMGGAIAAVLATGCFVGARIHIEQERRMHAERQFETAERITDQTLARTREQLAQRGIRLTP